MRHCWDVEIIWNFYSPAIKIKTKSRKRKNRTSFSPVIRHGHITWCTGFRKTEQQMGQILPLGVDFLETDWKNVFFSLPLIFLLPFSLRLLFRKWKSAWKRKSTKLTDTRNFNGYFLVYRVYRKKFTFFSICIFS